MIDMSRVRRAVIGRAGPYRFAPRTMTPLTFMDLLMLLAAGGLLGALVGFGVYVVTR